MTLKKLAFAAVAAMVVVSANAAPATFYAAPAAAQVRDGMAR